MLITVFFKHKEGQPDQPKVTYELDLPEFKRLSHDFENFLKTGAPKEGLYKSTTLHGDSDLKTSKMVRLKFNEISAIG